MNYVVILIFAAGLGAQTGTLKGRVVQTGPVRALQGVTVSVSRAADLKLKKGEVPAPAWYGRAGTNEAGEYQITGIPPGEYLVCAQLPDSLYLDTCDADRKRRTMEIATTRSNVDAVENIVMERGTLVYVVVEDAARRLTDNFQKSTAGMVTVWVKNRPARLAVVTKGMALYRMTVARNALHDIEVSSPGYRFGATGVARSSLMTDGQKDVHEVRVAVTGFVAGGK